MSLFHDPRDEDRLYQALKAYVEEWGPTNITVLVPAAWKDYDTHDLGMSGVKIDCSTVDIVSVLASEDGEAKCGYHVRLKEVPVL